MVFVRRCLIVSMNSIKMTTVAILLVALEEMLLRATVISRDELFNSLFAGAKMRRGRRKIAMMKDFTTQLKRLCGCTRSVFL